MNFTYQGIHHLSQHLQVHCLCYCCLDQCVMTVAANEAVQCHCLCCPGSSGVQSVSDSLLLFAEGKNYKISYYHNTQLLRENVSRKLRRLCSQSLSVYTLHISFGHGKFRNRDDICCLKACTNSVSITENAINVYMYKRILLPAFH